MYAQAHKPEQIEAAFAATAREQERCRHRNHTLGIDARKPMRYEGNHSASGPNRTTHP